MTRHSRNSTANAVYSYHEKKNDAAASGYGTLAARYGKDGVKDFDCCCLSLHPCRDPVISQDGYLFDKEAILEYIIKKKGDIRRKLKEYEKQSKKEQQELKELSEAEQQSRLEKFLASEKSVKADSVAAQASASSSSQSSSNVSTLSNMIGKKAKHLPSYWVPVMTPDNKEHKLNKPVEKVLCPMSGQAIKMKDFMSVKFTVADASVSTSSLEGRNDRYKCPVTGDLLRNSVPCAVLRQTGDVVTMEAVRLIRKDMKHPMSGQTMTEKDIIPMQRGGTGFAQANELLAGEKARPVMQA